MFTKLEIQFFLAHAALGTRGAHSNFLSVIADEGPRNLKAGAPGHRSSVEMQAR